jgi:hypothetical protein
MSNISNVIILGAGASAADGAPVQNKLIRDFFNSRYHLPKNKFTDQEKIIFDYFKSFWGIRLGRSKSSEYPTFEECLGVLDLAYLRGDGYKNLKKEEIITYRSALVYLIAKLLDEKLRRPAPYHRKLVNKLLNCNQLGNTSFISLNYDIIIDNEIVKIYEDYYLNYGIDFINFDREDDWERPKEDQAVLLLKIHGSLNWIYCPTCNHIELVPTVTALWKR